MAVGTDRDVCGDPSGSPPPRPEPSRRSYLISLAVAVVLFVAIVWGSSFYFDHFDHRGPHGGSQALGGGLVTSTTQVQATTSTAGATTTTTVNPADIPSAQANPPSLAGAYSTDPIVVLKALSSYSDWLFAHPDPNLLSNYMQNSSPHYNAVKTALTTLVDNDWHARPSVTGLQWYRVDSPFTPEAGLTGGHPTYFGSTVRVVIAHTPASADILDSAGHVVSKFTSQPSLQMLIITLSQGSDGRFRIQDEAAFNPPGGVAEFES